MKKELVWIILILLSITIIFFGIKIISEEIIEIIQEKKEITMSFNDSQIEENLNKTDEFFGKFSGSGS